MKNLIISLLLIMGISQFSSAQINDNLPTFKQEKLFNKTLKPFLSAVIYNEGVAALKSHIDPNFKSPSKGWINKEFVQPLGYYLGQAYTSNKQAARLLDEFEQTMVAVTPGDQFYDGEMVIAFFELPNGKITSRGAFDPVGNALFYPCGLPVFLESEFKDLDRVFGLVSVEKPNGQFKLVPDVSQLAGFGSFGTKSFKGSDEELQAARTVAEKFLKAIRQNDLKAFKSVFDEDAVRSAWHEKLPLSNYRGLPEYTSSGLKFERITSFENQAGWRGHFSMHVAVFRLPEGMKASSVRAPTDFFNPVVFPAMDGSSKEPAYKVSSNKAGFTEVPKNFYESIVSGPIPTGNILGNEGHPENFITVVLTRKPGTNNFNIGMPPSLK